VPLQQVQQFATFCIPNSHRFIRASAGQPFAVRTPRDAKGNSRMPLQCVFQPSAIPNFNDPIPTTTGQVFAVRAPRYAPNRVSVALQWCATRAPPALRNWAQVFCRPEQSRGSPVVSGHSLKGQGSKLLIQ
jgi:hypothetical protein